jgi:hypothetical protein
MFIKGNMTDYVLFDYRPVYLILRFLINCDQVIYPDMKHGPMPGSDHDAMCLSGFKIQLSKDRSTHIYFTEVSILVNVATLSKINNYLVIRPLESTPLLPTTGHDHGRLAT